ncbi:Acyl-CoA-binding domain-containing protein 2 [Linum grandiflorum]
MVEWHQLLQSIILGLIFSYLLAKLIAIVVAFKDDNLTIVRNPSPSSYQPLKSGDESSGDFPEGDSIAAELGSVRNDSAGHGDSDDHEDDDDSDDDDDWEGVESTELDEIFSAASAFVAAAASDRLSQKVSTDVQLQLYGLYKIATEGPCTVSAPSALKMTARAKWTAWQKLGTMSPEEAMEKYIDLVSEIYPAWDAGSAAVRPQSSPKPRIGGREVRSNDSQGPMGPVFSTFVYEEESGNELKMDAVHGFAREGDADNLLKSINHDNVSVNLKDSEGRTPLHWAVDRGHLNIVELLVEQNADINAKDNEGQTALHYAVVCDREGIADLLVKQNANVDEKDNDGMSAKELCESNWSCLQKAVAAE